MMCFALDNISPGGIAIISGDRDFAYAAASLRLRGHRVLIISPSASAHSTLKSQADILFNWQTDVLQPAQHVYSVPDSAPDTDIVVPTELPESPDCPSFNGTSTESGSSYVADFKESDPRPVRHASRAHQGDPVPTIYHQPEEACSLYSGFKDEQHSSECTNQQDYSSSTTLMDCPLQNMEDDDDSSNSYFSPPTTPVKGEPFPRLEPLDQPIFPSSALDSRLSVDCMLRSMELKSSAPPADIPAASQEPVDIPSAAKEDECELSSPSYQSTETLKTRGVTAVSDSQVVMPGAPRVSESPVSDADRQRFSPLISVFKTLYMPSRKTKVLSSRVATDMLRIAPRVYELAGVMRLKAYIEAARMAKVIISPGLDRNGNATIEINPLLLQDQSSYEQDKSSPLTQGRLHPHPVPIDPNFTALVDFLRLPSTPSTVSLSYVRMKLSPSVYQQAGASSLSEYLARATRHGIVEVQALKSNRARVRLTADYRK